MRIGGHTMFEILATHQREIEDELRERVQFFFAANNETPESVSIEMKIAKPEQLNGLSTIHILVKDACTGTTLLRI